MPLPRLDAQRPQLDLVQAHAAQVVAIAAQALDRVDAHAAQHLFDFQRPGPHQVGQPAAADVGFSRLVR